MDQWLQSVLQGAGAAVLAGFVGAGEIISRYKDDPVASLKPPAAKVYVAVNALAAIAVFALTHVFDWSFGASPGAPLDATRVMVAGFGSIALLRTSLFTVRAGDQDIGIGPNALLTSILAAADRQVDRTRAEARATTVGEIMQGVSYAKANVELPALCLALMQNVGPAEQEDVAEAVRKISDMKASDELKSIALGLALLNVVGDEVLKNAVGTLGTRIKR